MLLVSLDAASSWSSRRGDPIEDDPGERRILASNGSVSLAAGGVEDDRPVGVDLEAGVGLGDVVADDEVERACARSFSAACSTQVVGLGREADEHLARRLVAPEVDEEVVGGLEHDLGDALVLLELARPAAALGRKSATAAAITIDVGVGARGRAPRPASPPRSAPARSRRRGGAGRPMVVTSVTAAPRRAATSATA